MTTNVTFTSIFTAGDSVNLKPDGVTPSTCAHNQCTVPPSIYNSTSLQNEITCGCHGSRYKANAELLGGPALRSLRAFEATLDSSSQLRITIPEYRFSARAAATQAIIGAKRIIQQAGRKGRKPEVGIAKNWTFFHAYKRFSPWDRLTSLTCHYTFNKFVLDAFLGGGRRDASTFIGLNYYGRVRFHHFNAMIPASGTPVTRLKDFGFVCDDMVERYPKGLGKILPYLQRKFQLPIYITEHGAASSDEDFRERDLLNYLAVLHGAIDQGVDVRGFYYWSLLDNFEWQFGYSKKFGLLGVDFGDAKLSRSMKPLGRIYSAVCRKNALVQR